MGTLHSLYPPQQDVLDHAIPDLGFSSVLSLPTGAGKTKLAEIAMDRALSSGERVAYLTPLKALAEEQVASWGSRWPEHKVGIFTGDYEASRVPVPYRDAEVLICTYERLDGILRHWQRHLAWLSKLGLVVVDEFHLLMDPSRGARLEGTISRLRRSNPFCRVMGLSGTVSNHAELADWLDGVSYHSDWRPIPLRHEVRRFKRLADKPDIVSELVADTAQDEGQTLVFVSSRRRAEQMATFISRAGYPSAHHHAGLDYKQRHKIESSFRSGDLTCLVTTPTLEMGLNLPCRTVVIADNTRWNGETFAPLPVWNYLQRAGRAGRPGQDGAGRAVLLTPSWGKKIPDYAQARPEPVRSQLHKSNLLAEQILIEVASRSCRTRAQLRGSFLPSTLAYRQDQAIINRFDKYLDALIDAQIVTEQDAILRPTRVGWISVRHQLAPTTTSHLLALQDIAQPSALTDFDLLLYHCWDTNLQPQIPLSIEVTDTLEDLISDIPSQLLDATPPSQLSPRACAAGVLMATLAWQYACGSVPEATCEALDTYPSDAEMLRQALVRLMTASADLHAISDEHDAPEQARQFERILGPSLAGRIRRLSLRIAWGLDDDTVSFTLLPGCGGLLAKRLFDAGVTDLEALCIQEEATLSKIPGIGKKRAATWVTAADQLMRDVETTPRTMANRRLRTAMPTDWPNDIEPGRLRRALSLTVKREGKRHWVSGGAEEHQVQSGRCDCADYLNHGSDWWCKHRLAVRLSQGDQVLTALSQRLADVRQPNTVAGHLADLSLGRRWLDA